MRRSIKTNTPDYFFIALVVLLVIFGLVMLASASSDLAKALFGNSYYYLLHQIYYGLSFGIIGFAAGALVPFRNLAKFAIPLLVVGIILLILVFTPLGLKLKGSERWIAFGPVTFQPGEFMKLAFLIFLAAWISKNKERSTSFARGFIPFLILIGLVAGLLVLQPSTTIAVIIFLASAVMYFAAGARLKFLLWSGGLVALCVAGLILVTPYRMERINAFFHPNSDPLGATYHINQAQTAIGSGGLWGVGYGESTTKVKYLPEPIGDSIFAVIGEELGFAGAMGMIALFGLFIWRGMRIALKTSDLFGRLMVTGFVSLIGIQAFINIGAISGIIPLTGVPLPFVSYGGTALAVFLTMSGIIVNISKYQR